jgi:hypothetical protein
MTDSNELLAAAIAAAGYDVGTVAQLIDATLPRHGGDDLDADQALALVEAIDVTARAGTTDDDLRLLVPALKSRYGLAWRERFWRGQLRAAAIRASRPQRYGASPVQHVLERAGRAGAPDARGGHPGRSIEELREAQTVTNTPDIDGQRAEQLAARILVPVELPRRLDGTRLNCLSATSLAMFLKCPEQWRRHYLCRERFPATPAMALGSIVDAVVGQLVLAGMAGRELPADKELIMRVDDERDVYLGEHDVAWTEEEPRSAIEQLSRDIASLFAAKVVPTINDPIAVQRKFRFKLAPQASWDVIGAIDIEETRRVRDTKVKSKSIYGHDVEGDVQASTYLLARLLEQHPAELFLWDILLKPGKQRRSVTWTQVPARRSVGRLRSTLIRYAAAARRMAALDAAFGPDEPWDFADPRHKLCSERYCGFFSSCPGGSGLADAVPALTESPPVDEMPADPVAVPPLRGIDDQAVLPAPPDPKGILLDAIAA